MRTIAFRFTVITSTGTEFFPITFDQEASGRVVMPLVPAALPSEEQLAALHARMRTALDPGIEFEHRIVNTLEFEPGGKTKRFKSELQSDYD
jgi:hypothetical protein